MKLKFIDQEYQTDAVNSVVGLFNGQEINESTFTIDDGRYHLFENGIGYSNALLLTEDQIIANMREIQRRNKLPITDSLEGKNFSLEMETATGKTYVYIKTILELNKQYGFTKFVIVVPSVAIREGVYKSFEITKDHFAQRYDNAAYRYFIYDSKNLSMVRDFATNNNIEIMIINIDAFKKSENIINQENDRLNGEKAITFIQNSNPVVIIDEPQSVDNTPKSKEAIATLNPLCVLRYSATHRDKTNVVYRLTPVDAYQMGLVKQICVSSNEAVHDFNKPYIRLVSVDNSNGFTAKIELDIMGKNGVVKRSTKAVKPGADLFILSGERELYKDYILEGIDCTEGQEGIEFSNQEYIKIGDAVGDVADDLLKRAQIRRTIEVHLDKELILLDKNIKVLSLFFIDKVEKYRIYDQPDSRGIYAKMFEDIYNELLTTPKYTKLKEKFPFTVDKIHDGYFSKDGKGRYKDTKGESTDDYSTYNTIMRDKEFLLSFDSPLRFIFSHSALKEGWDNPNIFQVCTLIEHKSIFTCRQKIGRGLRLCVNQDGDRIDDRNINILHIIANENFAEFADKLQKEIEAETGIKFGILDIGLFIDLPYTDESGTDQKISHEEATELIEEFKRKDYITHDGKIKSTLKNDLLTGKLDLPKKFEVAKTKIEDVIKNSTAKVPVRNYSDQVTVKLKKEMLLSPEFLGLWNRIKHKTTYRVNIDTDTVVKESVKFFKSIPPIPKTRITTTTAKLNIEQKGVTHDGGQVRLRDTVDVSNRLPDVLSIIKKECLLTRPTIVRILTESGRLEEFAHNPQKFIEALIEAIKIAKSNLITDGISYKKLAGEEYYALTLFDSEELIAYLDKNAIPVQNSIYDHIIYGSRTIEKPFAEALDQDEDVKMFFKLPREFKINTPIGSYNPDWAVYLTTDGVNKLYFVLETKGDTNPQKLRKTEDMKIHCGIEHFKALEADIEMQVVTDWKKFKMGL